MNPQDRGDADLFDRVLGGEHDHRTLMQTVRERLRHPIIEGEFPPGTPLRPQHLASRLGVSVMPVREALRMLAAEDLVTMTPRRGARVASLSPDDVEEIYLMRGALEGLGAKLAVAHMSAQDLRDLRRAYNQMVRAYRRRELAEFIVRDREFHELMYSTSGRPSLVKKILELWDSSRRMLAMTYRTAQPMEPALTAHLAILEACEAGDAKRAESATREHTEEAASRLLAALRSQGQGEPTADRSRRREGQGARHRSSPAAPVRARRRQG